MKRQSFAAALILGAATTLTLAQAAPEVPQPKCEPKPVLPGPKMMEDAATRKNFQRDLDAYRVCITTFVEERRAVIKANEAVANAAIEDYNSTVKALTDAQKAK